jgi:hypothetical protein
MLVQGSVVDTLFPQMNCHDKNVATRSLGWGRSLKRIRLRIIVVISRTEARKARTKIGERDISYEINY